METTKYLKEKDADKKLKPEQHMKEEAHAKPIVEEHVEEEAHAKPILLDQAHYEQILWELFPQVTTKKPPQTREQDSKQTTTITSTRTTMSVEDQFKEMIRKVLQELQEDKSVKKLGKSKLQEDKPLKTLDTANGKPGQDHIPDALIEETEKKIKELQQKMNGYFEIKGLMDKIRDCLRSQGKEKILVILKLDNDWVSDWKETTNAFGVFGHISGALMLTLEGNMAPAKEYCFPLWEPIDCSFFGLYRDNALKLTNQHMKQDST